MRTSTPSERPSVRATGETTLYDGGTVRGRYVAVFDSTEAAGVDRVPDDYPPWDEWKDVETTVDGRTVVAEGTRPDYSLR